MTPLFVFLVVGAILSMGWAFLAAGQLEEKVDQLEQRLPGPEAADEDAKRGTP